MYSQSQASWRHRVQSIAALALIACRSFFQSVCVLGYCLFPLTIAALINIFVDKILVRLPVAAITYTWSSIGISSGDVVINDI